MKDFAVYLDLDGVMADYDAGIKALGFDIDPAIKNELNRPGTKNPLKREMYEKIKGTDFYAHLPLLPGAVELYRAIADAGPIICTASPKFGATEDTYYLNPHWLGAAYHKRRWVEEKLLPAAEVLRPPALRIPIPDARFVCTTSARKWQFMHRKHSPHQILIDDRIANCEAWVENFGIAIFHDGDAEATIANLEFYRDNPDWHKQDGERFGLLFKPRDTKVYIFDPVGAIAASFK